MKRKRTERLASETAFAPASPLSTSHHRRSATRRRAAQGAWTMRAMRFRPCIDLHDGCVKQLVGGTLRDDAAGAGAGSAQTNFTSSHPSEHYALMYKRDRLPGGHIIMLGPGNADAARTALAAYPGGMQLGGGVTPDNAARWLDAGASHVIVTSYVFADGRVQWQRVEQLVQAVGKRRLVLDLSCRTRPDGNYVVCADRWQTMTDVLLDEASLQRFAECCDELLVHAVDVEGKKAGVDERLLKLLAASPVPVTYAGGVRSLEDLDTARSLGEGKVDVTVGSALDIFGGDMRYAHAVAWQREREREAQLVA